MRRCRLRRCRLRRCRLRRCRLRRPYAQYAGRPDRRGVLGVRGRPGAGW
ncbi:hypothetical protein [Actinocatenispora thailandica]